MTDQPQMNHTAALRVYHHMTNRATVDHTVPAALHPSDPASRTSR
jgi:hypothetical protein